MKVLVITTCTAEQLHEPSNPLQQTDFATTGFLRLRSRRLEEFETPATQMYRGNGHLHLMNGVTDLRHTFGQGIVDVYIISPGYGLLNERDPIVPYNYTFERQSQVTIQQRSRRLRIHEEIECLLSSYDLVFFLLSAHYITACLLPFHVPNSTQIFLVAPGLAGTINANGLSTHAVCVGPELVNQLEGANPRNLKGVVFERLCTVACERGENRTGNGCSCDPGNRVFEEVKQNPQLMIEMVLSGTE